MVLFCQLEIGLSLFNFFLDFVDSFVGVHELVGLQDLILALLIVRILIGHLHFQPGYVLFLITEALLQVKIARIVRYLGLNIVDDFLLPAFIHLAATFLIVGYLEHGKLLLYLLVSISFHLLGMLEEVIHGQLPKFFQLECFVDDLLGYLFLQVIHSVNVLLEFNFFCEARFLRFEGLLVADETIGGLNMPGLGVLVAEGVL